MCVYVCTQNELSAFIAEYAKTATGPSKWEKLAEFLKDTYPALATEVRDSARTGAHIHTRAYAHTHTHTHTEREREREFKDT